MLCDVISTLFLHTRDARQAISSQKYWLPRVEFEPTTVTLHAMLKATDLTRLNHISNQGKATEPSQPDKQVEMYAEVDVRTFYTSLSPFLLTSPIHLTYSLLQIPAVFVHSSEKLSIQHHGCLLLSLLMYQLHPVPTIPRVLCTVEQSSNQYMCVDVRVCPYTHTKSSYL